MIIQGGIGRMTNTLNKLESPTLIELSTSELLEIEGGINWDNLIGGAVSVAVITGSIIGAPAVSIGATLFGIAYTLTRAFD